MQAVEGVEDAVELGLVAEGSDQGGAGRGSAPLGGCDFKAGKAVAPVLADRTVDDDAVGGRPTELDVSVSAE